MIKLNEYDLTPIKDKLNVAEENTVVFFVNGEYGYGYTYESDTNISFMVQDTFNKVEMLEGIDELIGNENMKAYVGEHTNNYEAVKEVVEFWGDMKNGCYVSNVTIDEVIELGDQLEVDYIIF